MPVVPTAQGAGTAATEGVLPPNKGSGNTIAGIAAPITLRNDLRFMLSDTPHYFADGVANSLVFVPLDRGDDNLLQAGAQ